jgi:MFS family permease
VTSTSAVAAPPRAAKLVMASIVPFGAGYFFAYLYRVINAVIAPNLVAEFSLSPADLGFLTSAYFMTYAAAQLPLGVLLDRYGRGAPRPACCASRRPVRWCSAWRTASPCSPSAVR